MSFIMFRLFSSYSSFSVDKGCQAPALFRLFSFFWAFFPLLISSCGITELGEITQAEKTPPYIDEPIVPRTTVVVGVTADSILVMREGEEAWGVKIGEEEAASGDIDMHRYLSGHLYTDFSTATQTIISRDGAEIFRYDGAERILFMAVQGGDVLTLGESRSGRGFSSRINGEGLFKSERGTVFQNAELSPRGNIRFFFSLPVNSTEGVINEYYAVDGAESRKITIPQDVSGVIDFAFENPKVFSGDDDDSQMATSMEVGLKGKSSGEDVWNIGILCHHVDSSGYDRPGIYYTSTATFTPLEYKTSLYMGILPYIDRIINSVTLTSASTPMLMLCEESNIHGEFTSVYLDSKRIYSWKGSKVLPMGFRPLPDGSVAGVVKGTRWISAELLYSGSAGGGRSLPEGYSLKSPAAILCGESAEDGVTLGLSSKTGGRAILWKNGEVDSLNFRGTVTAVLQE